MMQKVAGTGKSLWRGAAMKCGEMTTSNCPRKTTETARSGNALFLVDQLVGNAFSRASLGCLDFETQGMPCVGRVVLIDERV